jgi:DNA-binding transcriptional MerR regulator
MGHAAHSIPEKIFFKIGEVCDIVDVQAHVLRYWETEFPQLSPQKNRSGQRSYRRRDVEIALRIKQLLYEDEYTINGARKKLQQELRESSRLKIVPPLTTKEETHLREVLKPQIEDPKANPEIELDSIEDFQPNENPSLNEERREAIRNLASQLLKLREMLKTKNTELRQTFQRKY